MCNVELVILHFVVGAPVVIFTLTELVVTTPILEAAPVDSGRDRGCVTQGVVITQG